MNIIREILNWIGRKVVGFVHSLFSIAGEVSGACDIVESIKEDIYNYSSRRVVGIAIKQITSSSVRRVKAAPGRIIARVLKPVQDLAKALRSNKPQQGVLEIMI